MPGQSPSRRSQSSAVQQYHSNQLSLIEAQQALAERRASAQRQVAQWGMAQTVRLRNTLRAVEEFCPDSAPAAAVFVRMAEGSMIATALEFEAGQL